MKTLEYYLDLPYAVDVEPIPAELGGGFTASIPLLGKRAVCGDGETVEEALEHLKEVKKERLTAYIEEGLDIPEPRR